MSLFGYYMLFGLSYVLATAATYMNKKYQVTTGTGLVASSIFMIVNGIVSAIIPVGIMMATREPFQTTWYSLVMALGTVLCAAIATIGMMKAYARGQVAVVTVFSTVGTVVLNCAWGLLFLKERITLGQTIAVLIMMAAVLIMMVQKGMKLDKNLLWLLIMITVLTSLTAILGKQHQVEQNFATVNTYSYSIWIGIIRAIVFSMALPYIIRKEGVEALKLSKQSFSTAIWASVVSGSSYILTLLTAIVLPITITSPLGTALSIVMTTVMAWIFYKEKMNRKQILGILLCIIGIFLFAWS